MPNRNNKKGKKASGVVSARLNGKVYEEFCALAESEKRKMGSMLAILAEEALEARKAKSQAVAA